MNTAEQNTKKGMEESDVIKHGTFKPAEHGRTVAGIYGDVPVCGRDAVAAQCRGRRTAGNEGAACKVAGEPAQSSHGTSYGQSGTASGESREPVGTAFGSKRPPDADSGAGGQRL